jgi:hypothetical protein
MKKDLLPQFVRSWSKLSDWWSRQGRSLDRHAGSDLVEIRHVLDRELSERRAAESLDAFGNLRRASLPASGGHDDVFGRGVRI